MRPRSDRNHNSAHHLRPSSRHAGAAAPRLTSLGLTVPSQTPPVPVCPSAPSARPPVQAEAGGPAPRRPPPPQRPPRRRRPARGGDGHLRPGAPFSLRRASLRQSFAREHPRASDAPRVHLPERTVSPCPPGRRWTCPSTAPPARSRRTSEPAAAPRRSPGASSTAPSSRSRGCAAPPLSPRRPPHHASPRAACCVRTPRPPPPPHHRSAKARPNFPPSSPPKFPPQSSLEFHLRLQQFVELARAGRLLDAIAFARAHLSPWGATRLEEVQQAMALLAYKPGKVGPRYQARVGGGDGFASGATGSLRCPARAGAGADAPPAPPAGCSFRGPVGGSHRRVPEGLLQARRGRPHPPSCAAAAQRSGARERRRF